MSEVVTLGNYDGVHRGHRALIERTVQRARARGVAATAVFFDPHPGEVLRPQAGGPKLLSSPSRRRELLLESGIDQALVQVFNEAFAAQAPEHFARNFLCAELQAIEVVVGADFRFGRQRQGDVALLASLGRDLGFDTQIVDSVLEDGKPVSSSWIRQCLLEGNIRQAARLLGRLPQLEGSVVKGDGRGRLLGFPTANLDTGALLQPLAGVYACWVQRLTEDRQVVDANALPGVAHLGVRPTFAAGQSFEVHVLDFHDDLYGCCLRVHFAERLRGAQKFASVQALRMQIECDIANAKRLLPAARVL